MKANRRTISNIVAIEGVGLHSGIYTRVELRPAETGTGIVFSRTDLGNLRIPAIQSSTTALDYATTVGKDDVAIGTVEHLLSAVYAAGITDLEVAINGPEVPIVDGSAMPFVNLIDAAGLRDLDERVEILAVREAIEVRDGDKFVRIEPGNNRLDVDYSIDFNHPSIGRQSVSFTLDFETFSREIAPARTFGFLSDVEKLRAVGLARGGSVENCIVLDDEKVANGDLRFTDEFVRHKVLDLVGDLVLLGRPLVGRITASRAGHALHSKFVSELLRKAEEWESRSAASRSDSASTGHFAQASRQH
jgi:UDP-3-O-[3-hydroxymyristoyl] N-acetylglucosamine deacetylase